MGYITTPATNSRTRTLGVNRKMTFPLAVMTRAAGRHSGASAFLPQNQASSKCTATLRVHLDPKISPPLFSVCLRQDCHTLHIYRLRLVCVY